MNSECLCVYGCVCGKQPHKLFITMTHCDNTEIKCSTYPNFGFIPINIGYMKQHTIKVCKFYINRLRL